MQENGTGKAAFCSPSLHYNKPGFSGRPQSHPCVGFLFRCYSDPDNNRLTVETQSGASIRYDPRRLQGIAAYREITRSFSPGDRIQFTAPSKELDVANRTMATIVGIDGHQVTARLDGDNARHVTFDSREMRHFDHGYAVTSHSSQGVTAEGSVAKNKPGRRPPGTSPALVPYAG
jgi:hypothetical protein